MTTVRTIALIGSGPMAIYTLKHLITHDHPLDITVFEASDQAGLGMPYNPQMNADYMLCNAFSREIPPPVAPLIDWLKHLPERELSEWELSYHDLSARAFYPRVLIGEYLQSQFQDLCDKARAAGHTMTVRTKTRVTDIVPDAAGGAGVAWQHGDAAGTAHCDAVVIASGHNWPRHPQIDQVPLISPWPYTQITGAPGQRIGILGSSLSAVDVVVALGHARGHFEEIAGEITWLPNDGEENLSISMVSHMGVMPEGDFYYPFPYGPAAHLTSDAVAEEIAKGTDGLLDRVFALLLAELDEADPAYLNGLPPPRARSRGSPRPISHYAMIWAGCARSNAIASPRANRSGQGRRCRIAMSCCAGTKCSTTCCARCPMRITTGFTRICCRSLPTAMPRSRTCRWRGSSRCTRQAC